MELKIGVIFSTALSKPCLPDLKGKKMGLLMTDLCLRLIGREIVRTLKEQEAVTDRKVDVLRNLRIQ